MKKFIHSILACFAFAGAIQTPASAAQVQYFYYWRDDSHHIVSGGGYTSPNHVQFTLYAYWTDLGGSPRNVEVLAYYTQNIPGGTNVVIANYTLTNVNSAGISIGPYTCADVSYAIARLKIDGGAYATIFADATH